MKSLVGLLALAGALINPATAQDGMTPHVVTEGRIVLSLVEANLEGVGLELTDVEQTASLLSPVTLETMSEPMLAFSLAEGSDLRALKFDDGGFVPYGIIDGEARVMGGFTLSSPSTGKSIDFHGFSLVPTVMYNDGPGELGDPDYFRVRSADGAHEFECWCVKIHAGLPLTSYWATTPGDHESNQLVIKAWDLVLTESMARELGRPELARSVLAEGKLEANLVVSTEPYTLPRGQNITTPYGGELPPLPQGDVSGGADGGIGKDVALGFLGNMATFAHFGTFPDGRTAMAMSTTSCNVGDENVPWLAPGSGLLQEDHPGITQAIYRVSEHEAVGGGTFTRFEQVAAGWIKHGFFALSSSQCTPCQNPSNGTFLGVGCSDTYATSNNASQFYLGPYDEWDGYNNTWECAFSYFDGPDGDCIRDVFGAANSLEHRLEAWDADLDDPGPYYYGSMYLVRDDVNIENNIGTRVVDPNWTGSNWSLPVGPPGGGGNFPPVHGPPNETRWADADMHTRAGADKIGEVVLSVDVTQLNNGRWRYEYALFNWNLDRRIDSFTVPVCGIITDIYFSDWDYFPGGPAPFGTQADNDWDPVIADGNLKWEWNGVVPSYHNVCGPLEFNSLYNFGFTSTVGPADRDANLSVHDAGSGGDLFLAATRAPGCLNLTASETAPQVGETLTVTLQDATDPFAGFVITEIGGVPLGSPFVIALYVPVSSGTASLGLPVISAAAGVDFVLLAADHDGVGFVNQLSNSLAVDVQ